MKMSPNERRRKQEKSQFAFEVARIQEAAVELHEEVSLDWLKEELRACEYSTEPRAAHIDLRLTASGQGIWITGKAQVRLAAECGICLASTELSLEPEIGIYLFEKASDFLEDERSELTPEDLEKEWYEGEHVVLDGIIRDAIMLELPMTPKCDYPCSGPAAIAAANHADTIDPRLAPLARLKIEKEN